MAASSLRLLVIGATGGTGVEVVKQALEQGHKVTALVRNAPKLNEAVGTHANLTVIQGSPLVEEDVSSAVSSQDAVIVSLGNPRNEMKSDICSKAQTVINRAMVARGVKRLVLVTSMGVGQSYYDVSYVTRFFFWLVLAKPLADKEIQEQSVYALSDKLDWTVVRPGRLVDGPRKGVYRAAPSLPSGMVHRADVADFCLKTLSGNREEFVHKKFSLIY